MKVVNRLCWALMVLGLVGLIGYLWNERQGAPLDLPRWSRDVAGAAFAFGLICAFGTRRLVCPACSAYAGVNMRGDLESAGPLHTRVDGKADRRFKYNPYVEKYGVKGHCTKCKHEWKRWVA